MHLKNKALMVWIREQGHLSASQKLVAFVLVSYRNEHTFDCCPRITTVARASGLSLPTLKRVLRALKAKQVILSVLVPPDSEQSRPHNQYYFLHDLPTAIFLSHQEGFSGDTRTLACAVIKAKNLPEIGYHPSPDTPQIGYHQLPTNFYLVRGYPMTPHSPSEEAAEKPGQGP